MALRGVNYHVNDFVMLKQRSKDDLACIVAQIAGVHFDDTARSLGLCTLSVVPLGRINDILRYYAGDETILKDEVSPLFVLAQTTILIGLTAAFLPDFRPRDVPSNRG